MCFHVTQTPASVCECYPWFPILLYLLQIIISLCPPVLFISTNKSSDWVFLPLEPDLFAPNCLKKKKKKSLLLRLSSLMPPLIGNNLRGFFSAFFPGRCQHRLMKMSMRVQSNAVLVSKTHHCLLFCSQKMVKSVHR